MTIFMPVMHAKKVKFNFSYISIFIFVLTLRILKEFRKYESHHV